MSAPAPIQPVILCGGSGTRLWPVSRKVKPKPFLPLVGSRTLFEAAQDRVGDRQSFAPPVIVAGAQHGELIEAQARGDHRLVVEPAAKNTAPAIALAAALLGPDDIMLVCPSDHHIADEAAFASAARAAASLAREDWLVSFGIAPDHPETGYGYLHRGEALPGGYRIARFVEKPDLETAKAYLATGEYCWNGGIFAFRAGHFLAELERHRPDMARLVAEAVADGREEGTRFYPAAEPFERIEGGSVDYAVMENTTRAAMVPADMGWSDIGNWAALTDALAAEPGLADGNGNVARGSADLDGCRGVLTMSDGPRVSVVGLEDVCVIVCEGEVLVTTREGAQRVGKLPGAVNQDPPR
ncbi:MAG: sugar phosphate nucleotidyltransferase [Erythrobacter sp.]|jgi:mannose-1-phosphate guanylyltransferase/mannose-1-phosphate guanylyltransferase/mannose-6-phosphate isomerase|nr:sugar phosphate nucleotidyltransferase [Erythrobacter sp.]